MNKIDYNKNSSTQKRLAKPLIINVFILFLGTIVIEGLSEVEVCIP